MIKKLTLKTPIKDLYMVGPTYAQRLKKLEIKTVADLLYHLPFRYEDYRLISQINRVQPGEVVTIQGKIISFKNEYTRTSKKIQKAVIADQSGQIEAIWFNQSFLANVLKVGRLVNLAGKPDWWGNKIKLVSPEYELIKVISYKPSAISCVHTGRLVPVYPETAGVSSKWLRSRIAPLIKNFVPFIDDWLPEETKKQYRLLELDETLRLIHFPQNENQARLAKNRLAFEEMLLIHLAALKRKKAWQKNKEFNRFEINKSKIAQFIKSLPFKLTSAQKTALQEIQKDLSSGQGMNRLLMGDVGSGKTVVAAMAIWISHLNGFQSGLMAPTEILAQQHFKTLKELFKNFKLKIKLITSSTKKSPVTCHLSPVNLFIGTHALIFNRANFKNLGLVVIDEQHRFGVKQRAKLVKKGRTPHILTMTATPIPRSVALTLYADLNLSILDEMPPGRGQTKTWIVPFQKRKAAYQWIEKEILENKAQAFIICPLIEESVKESMKNIRAATAEFERLQKEIFPELKLGLIHGKMKAKTKDKVLGEFRQGKIKILVATPVVEVGIDIPQANIIIIEGAERFGLAQLHQLRGRVGRDEREAYCFLFSEGSPEKSLKRLSYLTSAKSGGELAEYDLKLRGPGELMGTRQHGFINLKAASFTDFSLIKKTKEVAHKLFSQLNQLPRLKKRLSECRIELIAPN